jgi:hypothetical protein
MLPRISQVSTRLLRGLGLRAQTGSSNLMLFVSFAPQTLYSTNTGFRAARCRRRARTPNTRYCNVVAQVGTRRQRVAITDLVTEIVLSFDQVRIVSATGKTGAAVLETTFPLLAEGAHVRTFETVINRDAGGDPTTSQVVSVLTPDRNFELHLDSSRVKSVQFVRETRPRGTTERAHHARGAGETADPNGGAEDATVFSIRWLDADDNIILNMIVDGPDASSVAVDVDRQRLRASAIAAWTAMRDKYGDWLDIDTGA